MNRDLRTVTGWIKARWGEGLGVPDAVHEAAVRLAGPRKAVKPEKRQRLTAKKESREERNARMAAIREIVFARAAGLCEFCEVRAPTEAHHLLAGSRRRTQEEPHTVAALCEPCHLAYHRSGPAVLHQAWTWARDMEFWEARAEIEHRIAKREEAKRAAGGAR